MLAAAFRRPELAVACPLPGDQVSILLGNLAAAVEVRAIPAAGAGLVGRIFILLRSLDFKMAGIAAWPVPALLAAGAAGVHIVTYVIDVELLAGHKIPGDLLLMFEFPGKNMHAVLAAKLFPVELAVASAAVD